MRWALLASALVFSLPALAGRALVEEPGIARAAAKVQRTVADAALTASGLTERCASSLKGEGLVALECRAVVAVAGARKQPLEKPADVDARLALAAELEKTAASVRSFEPLAPAPGFSRQRFDTHRALSRGALALLDEVNGLPGGTPTRARADELLAGPPRRLEGVCVAIRGSLELAAGADASLEERGALQSLLTSHRCFLDETRLSVAPKPGQALKNNPDANTVAHSVGDVGLLRQYADSRALDLQRCTQKHVDAAGRAIDAKKLEDCACGVVQRWSFPGRATETTASLPLGTTLHVVVKVSPAGRVASCGPLSPTAVPAP